MNYPDELFKALKRGRFPKVGSDGEKELRIAFLHGLNSGKDLILQASNLPDAELVKFCTDLGHQIMAELARVGERPGKVKISTSPIVPVRAIIPPNTNHLS